MGGGGGRGGRGLAKDPATGMTPDCDFKNGCVFMACGIYGMYLGMEHGGLGVTRGALVKKILVYFCKY